MVILGVEEHRPPWTPFRQDRKRTWIVPDDQIGLKLLQSMEIGGQIGVECAAQISRPSRPFPAQSLQGIRSVVPPLDDRRLDGDSTSHVRRHGGRSHLPMEH